MSPSPPCPASLPTPTWAASVICPPGTCRRSPPSSGAPAFSGNAPFSQSNSLPGSLPAQRAATGQICEHLFCQVPLQAGREGLVCVGVCTRASTLVFVVGYVFICPCSCSHLLSCFFVWSFAFWGVCFLVFVPVLLCMHLSGGATGGRWAIAGGHIRRRRSRSHSLPPEGEEHLAQCWFNNRTHLFPVPASYLGYDPRLAEMYAQGPGPSQPTAHLSAVVLFFFGSYLPPLGVCYAREIVRVSHSKLSCREPSCQDHELGTVGVPN